MAALTHSVKMKILLLDYIYINIKYQEEYKHVIHTLYFLIVFSIT